MLLEILEFSSASAKDDDFLIDEFDSDESQLALLNECRLFCCFFLFVRVVRAHTPDGSNKRARPEVPKVANSAMRTTRI
jgi:hypothetical protein